MFGGIFGWRHYCHPVHIYGPDLCIIVAFFEAQLFLIALCAREDYSVPVSVIYRTLAYMFDQ